MTEENIIALRNYITNAMIFIIFSLLGSVAANYMIFTFTGKSIPFIGSLTMGVLASKWLIVAAIFVWILKYYNIF
jgi:hypothetical protein